jgi:dolichol-phosphate mannosyltransferase
MTLSVVVPVYQEEEVLPFFIDKLISELNSLGLPFEIIFVLDPSFDGSEDVILEYASKNSFVKLITLSRRFGQSIATMAGINHTRNDLCVVIDCDFQDPPEIIPFLYKKIIEGYDVVYARRTNRLGDNIIKLLVSKLGYWVINRISDHRIPPNVGDFRIFNRRVIDRLNQFGEYHPYLRGLIAYTGFRHGYVDYVRPARLKGRTHYNPFIGSLSIGLNGLLGFSVKPLYIVTYFGLAVSCFGFFMAIWYLYQKITGIPLTPGLSTVVIAVTFFAGVQLLSLGLIGLYIGRIYTEVRKRPRYIIDKMVNFDN